jgi:uncharacterized protein YfaS (alpha-2-macroglobulin family)
MDDQGVLPLDTFLVWIRNTQQHLSLTRRDVSSNTSAVTIIAERDIYRSTDKVRAL